MRFWVGITDGDWFRFLAARPEIDEVNFWQPSAISGFGPAARPSKRARPSGVLVTPSS